MDTEKLDAKQMAALLDTASSTRNPVVFRIVRSGSRKTVAIPIKKVEHKKVEEKFPLRRNGSITLEAETGFVTTPTLSHAQTPLAVDSQRQQEGRLETPRSCDSAGGSTSGDGDRRWSVIHEGFSESPTSPRQGAFARTGCHHGHTADTCKHTHVRDIPIVDVSSCYANVTFTWTNAHKMPQVTPWHRRASQEHHQVCTRTLPAPKFKMVAVANLAMRPFLQFAGATPCPPAAHGAIRGLPALCRRSVIPLVPSSRSLSLAVMRRTNDTP
jgi:hypothetical protein